MLNHIKKLGEQIGRVRSQVLVEEPPELADDPNAAPVFDATGPSDARLLEMEGLRSNHTVLDFGLRTGLLALEVVPRLVGGHYIGADTSAASLEKVRGRVAASDVPGSTQVTWMKMTSFV